MTLIIYYHYTLSENRIGIFHSFSTYLTSMFLFTEVNNTARVYGPQDTLRLNKLL